MSKYISLLEEIAKLKEKLKAEGYTFYPHTLFGTEVDNEGIPLGVMTGFEAKAYQGIGLLDNLILLAQNAKKISQDAYLKAINSKDSISHDNVPDMIKKAANSAVSDYLQDAKSKMDPVIHAVIDKYKEDIAKALIESDRVRLNEIQNLIGEEVRKIKGDDFDAKFIIDTDGFIPPLNNSDNKETSSELFDSKNIKRFF